jgi:hypothetical protein
MPERTRFVAVVLGKESGLAREWNESDAYSLPFAPKKKNSEFTTEGTESTEKEIEARIFAGVCVPHIWS